MIEPIYRQIGERIANAREKHGLTITELAEAAGMGRPMLSHIESGRHRLMIHQLEKIARALGKKPGYFLRNL